MKNIINIIKCFIFLGAGFLLLFVPYNKNPIGVSQGTNPHSGKSHRSYCSYLWHCDSADVLRNVGSVYSIFRLTGLDL